MTISPLKRLQITQVNECMKYGISMISIDEDTPNDASLWQSIRAGKYVHLIVSLEQLSMFNGHLPCLLGQFRVLLSKDTTFQALSATLPPHILSTIKRELLIRSDHLSLMLSTNRPNITYAVTPLIGGLHNFHNFNCLIPPNYSPPMIIPKTLIFHDNKLKAVNAAAYNNSHLLKALQTHGVVKHYHNDMSPEYLQQTYEDFVSDTGSCRILHATAGASTGLDIHCVSIVIQYGVPCNMSEAVQRGGCAARDDETFGQLLMMVEPWALELELTDKHDDINDPDKPYAGMIKKNSSKQDRTGCAVLRYIQSKTCLREFYAKYLYDETPADIVAVTSQPAKRRQNQLRDKNEHDILYERLSDWRAREHAVHPLQSVQPITWLCDNNGLELLSKTHPNNLRSTEEWRETCGQRLLEVINQFTSERKQVQNLDSVAKRACIEQA
ncbi:hypothetical protein CY34DRAFT_24809 [Suillus luteus UH-Slu-Lm8-n1]|uniref:DNA 3'-5' helicase n=1 Tax=Suillus luteus UH-Slu-Lm8-n1 TaxID=930992 RepID=A0A0C9ZRR0_9AGAM|nr:hypothetical protein CY34DRAFT_24809 [Suillus luteus UH-Slu-Lm8-n1]